MTSTPSGAAIPVETRHPRWPAERFYWAQLDGSHLPSATRARPARLSRQLGYLLEGVLPGQPIEQMHAIYRRLPGSGRRYLACALPRAVLQEEIGPDALTLTPASLPDFVDQEVEATDLNLLTGPFLPSALAKLRRRWFLHVGLILATCAALLMSGVERRVHATRDQIASLAAAKVDVFEQVIGPAAARGGLGSQPPMLRLTAELRRLEQTRSSDPSLVDVVDCSSILTTLLQRWPGDVHAETDALSITPTSIDIRARVPTMADAQRFADAFGALPGWLLKQPKSEATRDHVAVTLRFEPREEQP